MCLFCNYIYIKTSSHDQMIWKRLYKYVYEKWKFSWNCGTNQQYKIVLQSYFSHVFRSKKIKLNWSRVSFFPHFFLIFQALKINYIRFCCPDRSPWVIRKMDSQIYQDKIFKNGRTFCFFSISWFRNVSRSRCICR